MKKQYTVNLGQVIRFELTNLFTKKCESFVVKSDGLKSVKEYAELALIKAQMLFGSDCYEVRYIRYCLDPKFEWVSVQNQPIF